MRAEPTGRITVTENGPYKIEGSLPIRSAKGEDVSREAPFFLCRCGQSQNKPFCDGSHARLGFEGAAEVADRGSIEDRRVTYEGNGITIYDDRSRCSHAAFCTDLLPAVWKLGEEPWIAPRGASAAEIAAIVRRCPSGALAYATPEFEGTVEEELEPEVIAVKDGPYWVRGGVPVVSHTGAAYEVRNRQTLCRCGQSKNKPFCDGSHWHIPFKDPA